MHRPTEKRSCTGCSTTCFTNAPATREMSQQQRVTAGETTYVHALITAKQKRRGCSAATSAGRSKRRKQCLTQILATSHSTDYRIQKCHMLRS
jgi:hypothetical protein